ncbi:hypothetical protein V8F20_004238 [Naviculisporaceae sp. PSN 640]
MSSSAGLRSPAAAAATAESQGAIISASANPSSSAGPASNNARGRGGSSRANRSGRGGRGGSVRGGGHVARGPGGGRVTRIRVVGYWAGRGRGGHARGGASAITSGIPRPSPSPSPEGSSSSSSSSSSNDDGPSGGSPPPPIGGQNALYLRGGEIDWRDAAIQEEILGLDFDPSRPFSPLAVGSLPKFAKEPQPAPFLDLEPWQLQTVGLLYPEAEFLLCRLPVEANSVLRVTGSNLARLGALTLGEPNQGIPHTQAVPGMGPGNGSGNGNNNTFLGLLTSRFGVALIRRDWPQGMVANLPPGDEPRAFVDKVLDTFGRIPGEHLVGSPQRDGITRAVDYMRYCRAFVPAAGRAQPDRARQLQWLNAQLGCLPQNLDTWQQMADAFSAYATAADPGGGGLAGGGTAGAGGADGGGDVASAAGG